MVHVGECAAACWGLLWSAHCSGTCWWMFGLGWVPCAALVRPALPHALVRVLLCVCSVHAASQASCQASPIGEDVGSVRSTSTVQQSGTSADPAADPAAAPVPMLVLVPRQTTSPWPGTQSSMSLGEADPTHALVLKPLHQCPNPSVLAHAGPTPMHAGPTPRREWGSSSTPRHPSTMTPARSSPEVGWCVSVSVCVCVCVCERERERDRERERERERESRLVGHGSARSSSHGRHMNESVCRALVMP